MSSNLLEAIACDCRDSGNVGNAARKCMSITIIPTDCTIVVGYSWKLVLRDGMDTLLDGRKVNPIIDEGVEGNVVAAATRAELSLDSAVNEVVAMVDRMRL